MARGARSIEVTVGADAKRFDVRVGAPVAACLERLEALAEIWGGRFEAGGARRGRLTLPVRAGVRHGVVEGSVSLDGTQDASNIRFDVERRFFRVQYTAFVFLLLGALGGLLTLLVPWMPHLLPLLPIGVILAVGAWLFIVARLTNSGPEEFFAELARWQPAEDGDAAEPGVAERPGVE